MRGMSGTSGSQPAAGTLDVRPRVGPGLGRSQTLGRSVAGWAFAWHGRLDVAGVERIPKAGPVILAANHRSMLDVPYLVIASPRQVYFMARADIFNGPYWTRLFHELGGFPVRRDRVDARAMDTALAILERGDALGIYPEGTRSKTAQMSSFLGGAAWLALRTGAPIVPCGIRGTEMPPVDGPWLERAPRHLRRKQVRVAFGEPIRVARETDPRVRKAQGPVITDRLTEAIAMLAE
jgi:1-acyl-sn-glycerol-3-phosphate acyltransferase